MSIQNLGSAGASPVGPQQNEGVNESDSVNAEQTAREQAETRTDKTADRVEISEAGRAAQANQAGGSHEVELGRSALRELSPSAEHLQEIRERVQDGYYNEPSTIKEVAERMANDLNKT